MGDGGLLLSAIAIELKVDAMGLLEGWISSEGHMVCTFFCAHLHMAMCRWMPFV